MKKIISFLVILMLLFVMGCEQTDALTDEQNYFIAQVLDLVTETDASISVDRPNEGDYAITAVYKTKNHGLNGLDINGTRTDILEGVKYTRTESWTYDFDEVLIEDFEINDLDNETFIVDVILDGRVNYEYERFGTKVTVGDYITYDLDSYNYNYATNSSNFFTVTIENKFDDKVSVAYDYSYAVGDTSPVSNLYINGHKINVEDF